MDLDDRRVVIRSFVPSVAVWCDCEITITSPDLIAFRFFFGLFLGGPSRNACGYFSLLQNASECRAAER